MNLPILSILIFFPMLGVVLITMLSRENQWVIKWTTLVVAVLEFIFSLPLWFQFNSDTAAMQFVEKYSWFPSYGISYYIGIDGISLLLVLLTTFLTPICVMACWQDIQDKVKEFMICLLFLETGMIGVFCALDLFLFYIFWEVMLIPMYLLIGVWGAPARRIYAAVKFFLFTMFGSLLMLVAILVLYFYHHKVTGVYTFDLLKIYGLQVPFQMQFWMFLAFALAFAIKVPMFPFHTWLPDAHTEAPTVGSVMLAAVLLKMGTYGFLRFNMPLFPEAAWYFVPLFSVLAIIGIIYGALVCMMQLDLKRLIAFSSVSHLGFVMLGLFTYNMAGVQGGIIQMINHGLSTGALFLIVGIIYERRHTRLIAEFGGLSTPMPVYAAIFMIVALSSIGLPGLNGFVGEFLILLGAFKVNKIYAILGASGVIFAACYMLWMFQRVMFGVVTNEKNRNLPDLSLREIAYLTPLLVFIVWIGVYPNTFLDKTKASTENFVAQMERAKAPKVALVDVIKGDLR
ncbi:MAG: NADH-quinone oxidoreductase subunit M [Deltaproteobacteria bacterium]|nr:NADH-quinone oxidoreductase subunit M [Deltaproteobacteria bacterium]MBW2134658.1 NADH-quinone oxidoreductase subunit M [Deltaproteobacteria bacterium]